MPEVSQIVDWMRTEFPGIKVLYAEEGQYRVGVKPDPSKYVVPCISEPVTPKKGSKNGRNKIN
jgi:hypothetical protein